MTFYVCPVLLLLFASFFLRFNSLRTADVARLHPVLGQNVKEFIHPRDIASPLFIERRVNATGFLERNDEDGDLTYRNGRFEIPVLSEAAQDFRKSFADGSVTFNGAFNVVSSTFRAEPDTTETYDRFSYEAQYQCLAIHTPYSPPEIVGVTKLDHFELVNALFVEVDSEFEARSFAYLEIDEDTGHPVFCGNTRVRASQVLQQNVTSHEKFVNGTHEPLRLNCSIEPSTSFSFCQPLFFTFGSFGGISARTTVPSQRKTIDWSKRAVNASQVGTPALFLTNISLSTRNTFTSVCTSSCSAAREAVNRQLAESNPGPIRRGTAVALVLVPSVLGLLLTALEVMLVTSTSVIKNRWGRWIIGALTLLDLGLMALSVIAAGLELPKMNVPLIFSSWYLMGNSELEDPVTVSSPIGDLQIEMWKLGEELSVQLSHVDGRNVTIAGLVLSCLNMIVLFLAPLLHKCLHSWNKQQAELY